MAWSPEQISHRLRIDFPDDESMRISPETIYQSLYVQGRGALKRELTACLRTGRALREPRARSRRSGRTFVTDDVKISQRPAEAADRAVPGPLGRRPDHRAWRSQRSGRWSNARSRYTMLLHLPRMDGFGTSPRIKNGPPLAGHGAAAVRNAITAQIGALPDQLRRSLTWDQGGELAQHVQLKIDAGIDVYFCDPHSPWQRPSNENTNGLLRQYFPKGTDLSRWTRHELDAVVTTLNARPRKTPRLAHPRRGLPPSSYPHHHKPVLHRPLEPAQYTSIAHRALLLEEIAASIGSVGDAYDTQSTIMVVGGGSRA